MDVFKDRIPAGLKYGPPSEGTKWRPQYCHWSNVSCFRSPQSLHLEIGFLLKILKGRKKKSEKEMAPARLPHCGLESRLSVGKGLEEELFWQCEFHSSQWKLPGMLLGPAGGCFHCHFYEMQTRSWLAGWPAWGYDEFFELRSASGGPVHVPQAEVFPGSALWPGPPIPG